ncbi:MAG: transcription-repair coupling factor [Oscillospiraceae bacterium]|nr:transcription-repair coupling factor [Oscillospiraceae bacterium]
MPSDTVFSRLLAENRDFSSLSDAVTRDRFPVAVGGLSNIHKAHFVHGLLSRSPRAVVILPDEAAAVKFCEDLNAFQPDSAAFLPVREPVLRELSDASREYEYARMAALSRFLRGEVQALCVPAAAAVQQTVPPHILQKHTVTLAPGDSLELREFTARLVFMGYSARPQVEGQGQFSLRGGILDIFPVGNKMPLRIELWGDEIDTIAYFELDTQRRFDSAKKAVIPPAAEMLYQPEVLADRITALAQKKIGAATPALLAAAQRLGAGERLSYADRFFSLCYSAPALPSDYADEDGLTILCEPFDTFDSLKGIGEQWAAEVAALTEEGLFCRGLEGQSIPGKELSELLSVGRLVCLSTFTRNVPGLEPAVSLTATAGQTSLWSGDYSLLVEEIKNILAAKKGCLIMAGTERAAVALARDLARDGFSAAHYPDRNVSPVAGGIMVLEGFLSAGFEYPGCSMQLITCRRTVSGKKRKVPARYKPGKELQSLSDLTPGDYVVHAAHGIGIYEGIEKIESDGVIKDYIKLRFAGTDTLFVPVTQLDVVSKYIGADAEAGTLKLNKLGSTVWQKTKSRVKAAVKDMAKELIRLYAERSKTEGFAFSADCDLQHDFEERFPYEETDDQLRCTAEIKADMERGFPMERLLCGDVGFGKTEVALRAAFKCVLDGKQCAILCPTTILAWQHYQTVLRRMEGFPVEVEVLSRFRTPKQQEEILRKLKAGRIDILIGTHRLIQKDVIFKDLGLAIIDEEQRFGVEHKERFKQNFRGVDLLSLSATPIPRTLNMAMSGIRDMSVLEEAPSDRYPVQTYVAEQDDGLLFEAIRKELRRGGQVYYLHNRTESIVSCAAKIARAIPEARVGFAHGKMSQEELNAIWRQLLENELDVLVCTTIIETGVDVPNCNTLIIEDADKMGLSQLYQIRGRVGRSNRRAYAYLTFRPGKVLTEVASKRLAAIREFTAFGSGFRIALRDLEIRGAGNILGASQHGHMESVGYDMYLRLLAEAVADERGETLALPAEECTIDLRISAHIPESYIPHNRQRIDMYKRIASIRNEDDAFDVTDEFIDRYGEPPASVTGLIEIALLRSMAALRRVTEITQSRDSASVYFFLRDPSPETINLLMATLRGRISFHSAAKPYMAVKRLPGQKLPDVIREVLTLIPEPSPEEASEPSHI